MPRKRSGMLSIGTGRSKVDVWLILCMGILILVGIVAIANATADPYAETSSSGLLGWMERLWTRSTYLQLIWTGVGLLGLIAVMFFDYRIYGEAAPYFYVASLLLMGALLFLPEGRGGVQAWYRIFQDRSFQPSEVCKLAIIVTLAKHISSYKEPIRSVKQVIPLLIHIALPVGVIVMQDDLGSAMVFLFIFIGILFVAGMSWQLFIGLGMTGVVGCVAAWPFIGQFRQDRILDFLDPSRDVNGTGYQVDYSKMAIGSGQFWGKGLLKEGAISQLDFVPEKHTDFIFAVTAESVGFLGCMLIIGLYLFLVLRLFYQAYKMNDAFGSYIIAGVASMFLFHIVENIGMTIGLLPVTGIPLPFMSYGGSNLVANMAAMGLVFNVLQRQSRTFI